MSNNVLIARRTEPTGEVRFQLEHNREFITHRLQAQSLREAEQETAELLGHQIEAKETEDPRLSKRYILSGGEIVDHYFYEKISWS